MNQNYCTNLASPPITFLSKTVSEKKRIHKMISRVGMSWGVGNQGVLIGLVPHVPMAWHWAEFVITAA